MKSVKYRPAQIEIDLSAIRKNIHSLQATLEPQTDIIAVVKANGYGHGDVQVARAALEAGATGLAVALLEEAIKLRESGIAAPILVMGWVAPEFADIANEYGITLTVFQASWLESYYQLSNSTAKLPIHIKLDTGMGRIGIREESELNDFLGKLDQSRINVTGVYTHFATADEEDTDYYEFQVSRFEPLLEIIKQSVKQDLTIHIGNSAVSLRHLNHLYHAVRFGIGMYGLYPSTYLKENRPFDLVPALSLKTQLSHVKRVNPGESISYGTTYKAEKHEWIGTIPIGYGDGIQRRWQNFEVLIDGKRMPLVGRICMDQCMVRLDQAYPIGTEVTFIGQQGKESIYLEEIATHLDTINYEVACLLTDRLPRMYLNEKATE
ncbi:alanine racemase [Amphibacillus xylanus]|uniref:Alanine racemase n=1 Tax=Amphibacillus xylanus (strain ATCC 51415 / DSM 6626 / JCM 7361 / LMG 17667 / NBRC 15112 / Ep01) TaxID=698758 RepID=K0IZV1_AMPXN|nr:alanine racemase [Amphibacillus xylanus]BAM46477.1 alanine racemase [Amphibacillus xylanus NBRC 15112]